MMQNTPIKFRILEYVHDNPEFWTNQIVSTLQTEYSMNTEHGRDMINYDLIELVSAGLIREGESKIDDGTYKNGSLVTQYTLTNLGEDYLNDLKFKVIRQV